jgi:pimeloyl-ACP methyl ester carboxylesterase
VFAAGIPLGREDIRVQSDASGTTVTSQGRLSTQMSVLIRRAEFKYRPDWTPESVSFDGDLGGADVSLKSVFKDGVALTEGTQAGKPVNVSHKVSAKAVPLMNPVFAGYAALARRLAAAPPTEPLRAYVVPQAEIELRVNAVHEERMQIGTTFLNVKRYEMVAVNPNEQIEMQLTATDDGTLLRFSVPVQGLDVLREDVAASTSRTQIHSNPGDEAVIVPVSGFNLGATITRPKTGSARLPAVVLLSGTGANDRDGNLAGVPMLGQLAGVIADAGMLAVRYDRRGFGQSGGRSESATLSDYSDDARAVVRWLAERKDVDPKRIAIVGHSEGAWVAMLTASRERRVAAVASLAGPGTSGAEMNLEEQRQAMERLKMPPAEREKQVAMQKQIQAAVLTGKGWEGIPPDLRKRADTPWFQSILGFDPLRVVRDLDQPLFLLHGELDKQVPVAHVDRLAEVAKKESDSKSVEVLIVRGVNHLLVPAVTGEISEYTTLPDRTVSKDVSGAVAEWLTRTFKAIK